VPTNATSVMLKFIFFNTEADWGFVYVDVCKDVTCATPLSTVALSGSTLPADVKSSTGIMRVRFVSDLSIEVDGFSAVYTSGSISTCANTGALIQTPMAVISDGDGKYTDLLNCSWRFAPASTTSGARVEFLQFNTEAGYDFVYVEQCGLRREYGYDGVLDTRRSLVLKKSTIKLVSGSKDHETEREEGWFEHAVHEGEAILKATVSVCCKGSFEEYSTGKLLACNRRLWL
jgi:hypothetical protein